MIVILKSAIAYFISHGLVEIAQVELEDELLELEPLDELLELELLEVLGFGILPTFSTLMNLPSKSNQKDEPIEIAIALII